jgi:hypothetical protein
MSVFVMGGTAGIVRGHRPDAWITFYQETVGKAIFGIPYRPFRQHPPRITNEVRVGENQPPITG